MTVKVKVYVHVTWELTSSFLTLTFQRSFKLYTFDVHVFINHWNYAQNNYSQWKVK